MGCNDYTHVPACGLRLYHETFYQWSRGTPTGDDVQYTTLVAPLFGHVLHTLIIAAQVKVDNATT